MGSNKPDDSDILVLRRGDKKVVCEILEKGECNKFTIKLEDHTIGNIINEALCHDPEVTFSAFRKPHPLRNEIEITMKPMGYAGVKLLADNIISLADDVSNMRKDFIRKVQSFKAKKAFYDDY
ncbi:DNA-directed RNA polymerase 2, putative [Hepatocystis sp. ex Piliocolobus tephrosceles]|nr:DNA-directed RNA polymerase 2, putative [Hepatocystis sp. ex Piliocolobus tephrosceles]